MQTCQPGWGQLLETGKWGKKIARANHFGAKKLRVQTILGQLRLV